MSGHSEPRPLTRPMTEAERRHLADVEKKLQERIATLRDTSSADGIQEQVLEKWRQDNPTQRGK